MPEKLGSSDHENNLIDNVVAIGQGEFWLPSEAKVLANYGVLGDGGILYRGKIYGIFEVLPNGRIVCKDPEGHISTVKESDVQFISPVGQVTTTRMIEIETRARAAQTAQLHNFLSEKGYQIGDPGPNGGTIVMVAGHLAEIAA